MWTRNGIKINGEWHDLSRPFMSIVFYPGYGWFYGHNAKAVR